MLSICIPIYNFDVTELVDMLSSQLKNIEETADIVLIDDCSELHYKQVNQKVRQLHKYIELEQNIGRAKIRNLFLKYTTADYLLFLDCDSKIVTNNFIQNYIDSINKNKNVALFCGGRNYSEVTPKKEKMLSWVYGIKRESKPYKERQQNPYLSFMTNNFMVKRTVLSSIPFDERLTKYGHEDTLFGHYLKQHSMEISHIENPVLNGDIEENEEYLRKTKLAIENLVVILKTIPDKDNFIEDVKLLSFYYRLRRLGGVKLVYFISPILNNLFLLLLAKGKVSLFLFNIYKLNYLHFTINKKG